MRYKFFDFVIDSEIDLPDLEPVSKGDPVLSVTVGDGQFEAPEDVAWNDVRRSDHDNQSSIGIAWSFAWLGQDLLLRVPLCGDFYIANGLRHVTCFPQPRTSASGLGKHLIYNVIPRIFGEMGQLVVHASCIQIVPAGGIVFCGPSGVGKSTLAASMSRQGADFVSDDSVLLRIRGEQLVGQVASPCVRLWDDSLNMLFGHRHEASFYARTRDRTKWKHRFAETMSTQGDIPIRAIFEIGRPTSGNREREVMIAAKSGAELLSSMVDSALLLDPYKSQTRASRFLVASEVAHACPAFYGISYPRNFNRLEDIGSAILNTVRKEGLSNHRKLAS